ncbi:MAG TPA: putative Ig domain-containing protein, partial [Tepidisphaeraceae bacterium]
GTPTNSYAGDNIVSVTVFDGTDYVAHKFTLNVAPINHAPTFSSNGITSATSEQVYTYNITTTDSDGDAVHLNAQKIPSWLSFTDNGDGTATLTGTPTNANVGSHLIEIKISDYQPLNSWDVQSFIIDVSAINHAPTFSSTASTSATADQGYTYNITATDLDGDPINFDKLQLPTWLKLVDYMEGTAILSGTPHNVDAGANQIKLSVTDGEGSRVQVFTIDVAAVNHKPVFSSQATTDVLSESKYSYTIKTSDEDGDALTISAQTLPAWLTFTDNGDGTATLKGTPTNASKGANAVVLKVSDGDLSDTQSFSVDVQAINHLPIFTSTAVTAATSESVYTYNIKTTDTDGDAVTITAATLPAWLTLTDHGNGTATLTGTPTNANKGANAITIFVTDKGQNVPQQFTIDVTPVNHAPSFPVTAASEALGGKFWTQTITVMEQDGDTLAIQALNLPGWMSFVDNHNGTATLKGTPTDADYGTDTYVLQVSDGKASAQQTFAVNVGLQDSYIDASGILHVNGTESADVLIVGLKDTYVRVSRNGVIKNYLRSKVSGVEVRGLGGADTITLSVPGMSGYAIGGEGNDTLSGGEEDDILTGGAGADRILGMGGNDRLNGMGGNDRIYGGDGGDRMYGGDGNDTIDGGSGVDRFYGEEGNDIFVANDKKKDILYGGAGTNSAIVDTLLDDSNDIDSFLAPGSVAKKHRRA